MKKLLFLLMIAGLLLTSVSTFVMAAPGDITNRDTLKELVQARQATKQYQNAELPVWDSLADGPAGLYVQVSPRVPGMGYHYANIPLVLDSTFDPAAPEILLYEDAGSGRRLIAVEYALPGPADSPPPEGFTGGDDIWHWEDEFGGLWTLHAWIWEGNPDGIFAPFNPNLP